MPWRGWSPDTGPIGPWCAPRAPTDPVAAVRAAVETARPWWHAEPQRQGQAIEIRADLGHPQPTLGYAAEVREALAELADDAVDTMRPRGRLSFAASPATDGLLLGVADTGGGPSSRSSPPAVPSGSGWGLVALSAIM